MEQILFSQNEIHNGVYNIFNDAKKYVIWFTMITDFNDIELKKVIQKCKDKKIKVYIFYGVNPFFNSSSDIIKINYLLPHYNSMMMYVSHIRYLSNESNTLFGGIDFNRIMENNYEHIGLKVDNSIEIMKFNNFIIKNEKNNDFKNKIINYQFNLPIVANSLNNTSGYDFLKNLLINANKFILIESQYIQHSELINIIINVCSKKDIKLIIIYNFDFSQNPFSFSNDSKINKIKNIIFQTLQQNYLNIIRKSGIKYTFLNYLFSYNHNKIYIVDDYFFIGNFNFHTRSFSKAGDIEIGYTGKSPALVKTYLDYIDKRSRNGELVSESN